MLIFSDFVVEKLEKISENNQYTEIFQTTVWKIHTMPLGFYKQLKFSVPSEKFISLSVKNWNFHVMNFQLMKFSCADFSVDEILSTNQT